MTSEERVIRTLRREEVDRVPIFEWIIDRNVIKAIYSEMNSDEFVCEVGMDAICMDVEFQNEEIEPGLFKNEWGVIARYNDEEHSYPVSGPITTMGDLEKYVPPDPCKEWRYESIEEKISLYGGNKALILHLNDVLSIPLKLHGFENLTMSLFDNPSLIEGLVELSVYINLEFAKEAVKRGVKIIYTGDDYAYNSGPFFSPDHFKKYFYPGLCKIVKGFKDMGLYVLKHTDGNIMPIVDMIVDSGIDCLDPIDPLAGMDLRLIHREYGNRVAIKGNVNCASTLSFGSREEVIEETKNCLRTCAPGRGYILSSSNTIHSAVKPENLIAMIETHKQYGEYPIHL